MMIFNDPQPGTPEYYALIRRNRGDMPNVPRTDWPINRAELIQRHTEIAWMAINWAVNNLRAASALAEVDE